MEETGKIKRNDIIRLKDYDVRVLSVYGRYCFVAYLKEDKVVNYAVHQIITENQEEVQQRLREVPHRIHLYQDCEGKINLLSEHWAWHNIWADIQFTGPETTELARNQCQRAEEETIFDELRRTEITIRRAIVTKVGSATDGETALSDPLLRELVIRMSTCQGIMNMVDYHKNEFYKVR